MNNIIIFKNTIYIKFLKFLFNNILFNIYTYLINFQYCKFLFFNNKINLYNEFNIYSNKNNLLCKFNIYNSLTTPIDLICYDNTNKNKLLINNNNILIYKLYNYINNFYINIFCINNIFNSNYNNYKIFNIYEREVKEFFLINFNNIYDSRNLLLDYSLNIPILKKNITLEYLYDLKNKNLKYYNSTSVEL